MTRDLGLRRALRRLDHLPAGVAVVVSVGLGGAIGFFCLRSLGEVSWPRAAGFVALVAVAVPLAISARPVAVPVEAPEAQGAPSTFGERVRSWPFQRTLLGVAILAVVPGTIILSWLLSRASDPDPSPLHVTAPQPSASSVETAPPALSSAPAPVPPRPLESASEASVDPASRVIGPSQDAGSGTGSKPKCGKFIKTNCVETQQPQGPAAKSSLSPKPKDIPQYGGPKDPTKSSISTPPPSLSASTR